MAKATLRDGGKIFPLWIALKMVELFLSGESRSATVRLLKTGVVDPRVANPHVEANLEVAVLKAPV
jgi:hypothetical protein